MSWPTTGEESEGRAVSPVVGRGEREKGDIFSIAAAMILAQPSSCSVQHPPAMQLCNFEQQQPTLPRRSGAAPPLVPHLPAHSTGEVRAGHICVFSLLAL